MNGGTKHSGYTIVEVMIFLAVTSVLFIVATIAVSGKQEQADFALGVADFQNKLNDVLNDVSTGYYPKNVSYTCGYTGGVLGATVSIASGGPTGQAQHQDCIFLGKVIYFNGLATPPGAKSMTVITVAGGRQDTLGDATTSFATSKPVAISSLVPGFRDSLTVDRGLVVAKVITAGTVPATPGAIGMFTSFPQSTSGLVAGSLTTDLVAIPASNVGDNVLTTEGKIANMATAVNVINPTTVICLQHGGNGGKRAAVIIGLSGRQVSTEKYIGNASVDAAVTAAIAGATCP